MAQKGREVIVIALSNLNVAKEKVKPRAKISV